MGLDLEAVNVNLPTTPTTMSAIHVPASISHLTDMECGATPGGCQCKPTHYHDNNVCYTSKYFPSNRHGVRGYTGGRQCKPTN